MQSGCGGARQAAAASRGGADEVQLCEDPGQCPPPPPPGLQRHTKEVKLQRDEQAYIDDLVKKVHVHKQHSKLTK